MPLTTGLRILTNDDEMLKMCFYAGRNNGVAHVYYEHGVSEPDYVEDNENLKSKWQNPSPRFFAAGVPGSALPLLPLPSVQNPGSSARRPHPRWLLCLWPGKKKESKSNRKLDKKVQFYSKVKDAVSCLSAQKSIITKVVILFQMALFLRWIIEILHCGCNSHLEAVDPVVEGKTRAKQYVSNDSERIKNISILIHGDGSLPGQGVAYESLRLSAHPNYSTRGTVHLVLNNQGNDMCGDL
ncbi:2-oxoglutarate dehydrogenase [Arachis hypogaea]|nr:2-oxoglutarate dehydrogenase [Arachis hypogaea]